MFDHIMKKMYGEAIGECGKENEQFHNIWETTVIKARREEATPVCLAYSDKELTKCIRRMREGNRWQMEGGSKGREVL